LFKTYYQLTKPGIIYGNAINTAAGFFLGAGLVHHFYTWTLLAVLAGSSLVIASGCVFNNYIDRGIDHKMARTKKRALVSGTISGPSALIYASILGVAGFAALALYTNWLTVGVGAVGYFFYIVMYSLWWKRKSMFGTIVGSVSGAVPPVAGYTAVTGHFDAAAAILFFILVFWQMPHFYAIAMYRRDEYAAAGVPVLPVKKGMHYAKIQIVLYIVAFIITASLLTVLGYTGYIYLAVMVVLGLAWLRQGLRTFHSGDDKRWGRKMFFFSLIVTLGTAAMLSTGALLP
jgi:protoheme IX farnesyltransferase